MAEEEVGPEILREVDLDELPTVEEEEQEQEQEPVLEGPSIDPNTVLELGDRILIEREGGDVKVGTIYYRTGELLRLKVDGDNTRLIDYPREYTEEEDRFDPELQVVGSYIIQKRTTSKFTEQQGFQAGQTLQGWKGGIMGARYRILRIIEKDELENERDAIEIQNTEDETDSQILDFDFVGIPENEPFDILNNLGFLPEKAEEETEKAEPDQVGEEFGELLSVRSFAQGVELVLERRPDLGGSVEILLKGVQALVIPAGEDLAAGALDEGNMNLDE
jgi:hypothetical protein